jgi:hypothetical protein
VLVWQPDSSAVANAAEISRWVFIAGKCTLC